MLKPPVPQEHSWWGLYAFTSLLGLVILYVFAVSHAATAGRLVQLKIDHLSIFLAQRLNRQARKLKGVPGRLVAGYPEERPETEGRHLCVQGHRACLYSATCLI